MTAKYVTKSPPSKPETKWDADMVKALREFMQKTQTAFAQEMGTQQQTVSEWECGYHVPKGMSVRMLNMLAERVGFKYQAYSKSETPEAPEAETEPKSTDE